MNKAILLVVTIVALGISLGFIFTPFAVCVAGMALWIILWVAQGGMTEGNPYKRMNMGGGVYNWAVESQYHKNEEIEIRDRGSAYTAIFIFSVGAILIIIGLAWMWLDGANFT